jgi:single-strand DNA-binding protein
MKTLRNTVQLIGNVGEDPKSHKFENGMLVTRFSMATNEKFFKDGEKTQKTQWHQIVAWGKQAELADKYISKGKEIAIKGKLTYRSYDTEGGEKRYITEILINEILLLGSAATQTDAN